MISTKQFESENPNYQSNLIGEGFFAKCYKISEIEAYKEFKEPIDKRDSIFRNLVFFEGLNFAHIIFPKELVINDVKKCDEIDGYKKVYIQDDLFYNANLLLLLKMIKILEKEVNILTTEYSIVLGDLSSDNIIINDGGIYIIDTDLFSHSPKIKINKKSNIEMLNYEIFEKITMHSLYEHSPFMSIKMEILARSVIVGEIFVSYFLEEYIKYLQELTQTEIKTVKGLRKALKQ